MWQRMKTIPDVNASLPEGALAMDETVASDDRESCLFNSCLLNFYRCEKTIAFLAGMHLTSLKLTISSTTLMCCLRAGSDHVSWHSDNEPL